ncbi:MAG: sensor histidine kinase [Bacteroidota bacterium]
MNYSNNGIEEELSLESLLKEIKSLMDRQYKSELGRLLSKVEPIVDDANDSNSNYLFHLINSRFLLYEHDYIKAESSIQKAYKFESNQDNEEKVFLRITDGTIKYYKADYAKALEHFIDALDYCEKTKEKTCLPGVYNQISIIYLVMFNIPKAEEYLKKAYEISDNQENIKEKSRAAGNLAIVFTEKKEFDKAEKWYLEDIKLDTKLNNPLSVAGSYSNLGKLYELKGDFKKSLSYVIKSSEILKTTGDKASIAHSYQNLAWAHFKNGNVNKAEILFLKSLSETKDLGNRDKLRDLYFNLSDFYESQKNFKKALDFQKKYSVLHDSLTGEKQLTAISELEIKYETQKKENELLKLSKQKQEDELVIARQNRRVRQLSFGLGAIALFGVLGFVLFRQRLQNKKQQELILAISETQTEERKRIAQDLHDSIGGSLALTKSKFEVAKKNLKAPSTEMDSALETLEQTTQQVRQISHNLMPGELVRFGLVAAINTLLENLNEEEINAQFHSNQGEERLEPLKEIQLYRIVQEALQNVLKHARANNLFIQLNKHQEHLTLMIEDDGKGIVQDSEEGMGLKNIKQRVQLLKGIFTIDSAPERGTILNIQIPV